MLSALSAMTGSSGEEHPAWVQKIHKLNDVLHQHPYDYLANGLFWYLLLLFSFPLFAMGTIGSALYNVVHYYLLRKEILPKNFPNKELAVVVTGCDTGFGKELVYSLVSRGFVVFPACLKKESFDQFQAEPKILPVQVDVTKDEDVEALSKTVEAWLSEGDKGKKRYLHAVVNNAGIMRSGLSDWLKISDFKDCMEVNFFGTVRCVKAFLPILKRQAADGSYKNARIVNMVSVGGLFVGGIICSAYEASKHALDAFTTNLRLEMKQFGIKVTAVNPGIHKTPMADGTVSNLKSTWDSMTPEQRQDYGEGECKQLPKGQIRDFVRLTLSLYF